MNYPTIQHHSLKLKPITVLVALLAIGQSIAQAQLAPAQSTQANSAGQGLQVGAVLDVGATSRPLELGARDQGLALGHSDLLLRGAINSHLSAEATFALHTEDGKLEKHTEALWVQTRSLPYGLQARLGRFASQVGYHNEIHPHADDFTERPLLYRALFGGHWNDDGVRINWVAPTPFYLRLGAEIFTGKKLVAESVPESNGRATTLNLKMGNDISANSSWQWGLSRIHNAREAVVEEHDPNATEEAHSHAASFTGKRTWVSDVVWKWAPSGNNNNQHIRLNWEYAQVGRLNRFADASLKHRSSALAAVWRFKPAWEVGLRSDWLHAWQAESDAGEVLFAQGRLREHAIMLAYKPTHMQTIRLQFTRQFASGVNDEGEAIFAKPQRSVQLQYVIGFGAHGAHAY